MADEGEDNKHEKKRETKSYFVSTETVKKYLPTYAPPAGVTTILCTHVDHEFNRKQWEVTLPGVSEPIMVKRSELIHEPNIPAQAAARSGMYIYTMF